MNRENSVDRIDRRILEELQRDSAISQRVVAERVGLSQNACWRRIGQLRAAGVLRGSRAVIDAPAVGLGLTVFVLIRTRHHDDRWADRIRRRAEAIPEITAFHRIGGEWDYLAQVSTGSMAGYDRVYKALIEGLDLERVTGMFSMETIFAGRPLPTRRAGDGR